VRRALILMAAAGSIAGCTAPLKSGAPVTLAALLDHRPVAASTGASVMLAQEALSDPTPPAPPQKLQCDAPSLAYLVGRRRIDIPVAVDFSRRRVTCTTCPPSEDRRPERTDILFDARTGLVTAVTCG